MQRKRRRVRAPWSDSWTPRATTSSGPTMCACAGRSWGAVGTPSSRLTPGPLPAFAQYKARYLELNSAVLALWTHVSRLVDPGKTPKHGAAGEGDQPDMSKPTEVLEAIRGRFEFGQPSKAGEQLRELTVLANLQWRNLVLSEI